MTVRPADASDLPALSQIAERAYAGHAAAAGSRLPPMDQDFAADIAKGACWVTGRPPAGYVVARPLGDDWLVENVAVDPDTWGRGTGRALIAFAEDEGRRRGFARVVLYTHRLMTANIAMYERLGYRIRTGVEPDQRVHFEKGLS